MRCSLQPSLRPEDYAFAHQVRVRFADTDAMRVVHHAAYLPYLEEARVEYLRALGRPYHQVRETGVDLVVTEVAVQFRRPLAFDDLVTVHLVVGERTRSTFQMAYLLEVGGTPHATAVTVHGCVDARGRAARLPAWVAELTGPGPAPSGR